MLQLPFSRARRFRPKVTASAIALTLAGMGAAGQTAEAADTAAFGMTDTVQATGPAKAGALRHQIGLFAPRHRPWRHHVRQRGLV